MPRSHKHTDDCGHAPRCVASADPTGDPTLRYRVVGRTDGLSDIMQVVDGVDLCPLGLVLTPETAALFAAAPEYRACAEALRELMGAATQLLNFAPAMTGLAAKTAHRTSGAIDAARAALANVMCDGKEA